MDVGIVGGGFAGRMAAVRLRRAGHAVTLVDAQSDWVERTRLHQAAATGRAVTVPHRKLLDRIGARFVQDRVHTIEEGRIVGDRCQIPVDRVVIAAGSEPTRNVPGVAEHALSLGGPDDARAVRERLSQLPAGATVVVVGAGLTGLELASEVAASAPKLDVVVIGEPPRDLSASGRRILERALGSLRIRRVETRVTSVGPTGLETEDGRLGADLTLWAAGFRAPAWLRDSGLPLDSTGRVAVDGTLRVVGRPDVVAAGDCAGTELRMACATAMPMGCHAAETLIREARGEAPRAMRFGYALRCTSLGRGRALIQGTTAADAPTWAMGGPLAVATKEAILVMAAGMAEAEARWMPDAYAWPLGPTPVAAP